MYQYQVTSTLTTTHYKNAIEDEQQDEWDGQDAGEEDWGRCPPRWKRPRAVKWTLDYAGDT